MMTNKIRTEITELTSGKDPFEAIKALRGYVAKILKQLSLGNISLAKAHRDIDHAYGYIRYFQNITTRDIDIGGDDDANLHA
jgi:hypothetical protein